MRYKMRKPLRFKLILRTVIWVLTCFLIMSVFLMPVVAGF